MAGFKQASAISSINTIPRQAQGRGTPNPWDSAKHPRGSEYLTPGLVSHPRCHRRFASFLHYERRQQMVHQLHRLLCLRLGDDAGWRNADDLLRERPEQMNAVRAAAAIAREDDLVRPFRGGSARMV